MQPIVSPDYPMIRMTRRLLISLFLPFLLLILFPIVVVLLGGANRIVAFRGAPQSSIVTIVGCLLFIVGLGLGSATIPLFLRQRTGTIMPWRPSGELIVEGPYRHVRNPMHIGVFSVLVAEGLLLSAPVVLVVAGLAILLHLFYIPLSEERHLERRFGEAYREYKKNVPRWIPRRTPWTPGED